MVIKIWHGSEKIIKKPMYNEGKIHNDYGKGFYCTESKELAKEWACKEIGKDGFANCYEFVTEAELKYVCEILSGFSKVEVISEKLMDTVVAVSGSSPAYVFMFIEAMADAAVEQGMPRAQAYKFAAQAVMGSAKMVLETGKHPGELKDMVCSPAGTTIKAVRVLEKEGLRSAVIEAMDACVDAAKGM